MTPPSAIALAAPNASPPDWRGIAALSIAVMLWGSAFTGIAIALEAFTPAALALGRFGIASLVLLVVAVIRRMPLPTRDEWPRLVAVSLTGITAYHLLLNVGQQVVPPGVTSLIIQTAPVFTALLAAKYLGERLPLLGWLGIAIATSGAAVLISSRADLDGFTWHALMILGCAVVTSIYFVAQQPLAQARGGLVVTVWTIVVGTIPMLVFAPQFVMQAPRATPTQWAALVYIGVCPAALAYMLWNIGLRRLGPTRASTFLYASPLVAVATEAAWRGTMPTALTWAGGALAIAGVTLVNRSRRRPRGGPTR